MWSLNPYEGITLDDFKDKDEPLNLTENNSLLDMSQPNYSWVSWVFKDNEGNLHEFKDIVDSRCMIQPNKFKGSYLNKQLWFNLDEWEFKDIFFWENVSNDEYLFHQRTKTTTTVNYIQDNLH